MNIKHRSDHTLALLETVETDSAISQRRLAQQLGVALGLANSYLKRCVRKGWVKAHQIPGNRYLYYLTPQGFIEKSRLTGSYLSHSLSFYRKAGESCQRTFQFAEQRGWQRIVLCGLSDLTEIAIIRAQAYGIDIVAVYDSETAVDLVLGVRVLSELDGGFDFDALLITTLDNPSGLYAQLTVRFDLGILLVPDILDWRQQLKQGE
ncbi:MAG: winged helix-turn-helix transcriptional regulator [Gammaproteobacteria bacterium]|nr:winged helix-turn-helix transcriptional regulator [Gammaproteobacteria bacterium]